MHMRRLSGEGLEDCFKRKVEARWAGVGSRISPPSQCLETNLIVSRYMLLQCRQTKAPIKEILRRTVCVFTTQRRQIEITQSSAVTIFKIVSE